MTCQIDYTTAIAVSDACKSLKRYGTVTAMRVAGVALFVAGLFVISRLAASIYSDATSSLDPTTLREFKIAVGIDASSFTDERLDALAKTPGVEQVGRLFMLVPTLQYKDGEPIVTSLESVLQDDVLFDNARMRVGREPRNNDEIVLSKSLADRLSISEEDVKKGKVEVTAQQERTRGEVKETANSKFSVVGVCRGDIEIGYIVESAAAKMNSWASGAIKSMDGSDLSTNAALCYLKQDRLPSLEEYAARNKLDVVSRRVLQIPRLETSSWGEIDPNKIDVNGISYQTYVYNYGNETFAVLEDLDPRLEFREESKIVTDDSDVAKVPNFQIVSAKTTVAKNNSNRSKKNDVPLTRTSRAKVKTNSPVNPFRAFYKAGSSKPVEKGLNVKADKPPKTFETSTAKNVQSIDWRRFRLKEDRNFLAAFGFEPEQGRTVRIVTQSESRSIRLNGQKTLEDCLKESNAVEHRHIRLETNVDENEVFYRRAFRREAIRTFAEQKTDELLVVEVKATEETPEETKQKLANYLGEFGFRAVKEKAEVETTINGVSVCVLGNRKNDPENQIRFEDVKEDEKGLELSEKDAQALGAFDWRKGDAVELTFTRRLESGKEENLVFRYRFLGINVESKIPFEDVRNIRAWVRDELQYHEGRFVDLAALEAARGTYAARVVAKSTDDAVKLTSKLKSEGFMITNSGVDKIENTKKLFKNLASFVGLFNIIGLGSCLLNIVTTDFLVIRLRKEDIAALLDLGVSRKQLFKEILAETVITAALIQATVVLFVLIAGKPLASSLLAITNAAVADFTLFDLTGIKILLGSGALILALAALSQISTLVYLFYYKRPRSYGKRRTI